MSLRSLLWFMIPAVIFSQAVRTKAAVPGEPFKTITFKGENNLTITADLYPASSGKAAPIILLFHQAHSNRGEYRQIAPKLVAMGFNCLAVDTRAGGEMNNVENETTKEALKKKMPNTYLDAYADLESALKWVKDNNFKERIIVWGSSFSASLIFRLAYEHYMEVSALLAFSPGEYIQGKPDIVSRWAKNVKNIPCFVACGADEAAQTKPIYNAIPGKNKTFYLPKKGGHGSSIIKDDPEANWKPVPVFLESVFNQQ